MQKPIYFLSALLFATNFLLPAFEWPMNNVNAFSFSSGFAELRGNMLSGSLVFIARGEVRAADAGIALAIIRDPDNGSDRFYSPLGNAVAIDHNDDLLTVYGNLDTIAPDSVPLDLRTGDVLGFSGASGWQGAQNGLEFQVIDVQQERVINPKRLMRPLADEHPARLGGLSAASKRGENYRFTEVSSFPTGLYTLYHDFDWTLLPNTTTVSVNGTDIETVTYDMMVERNGKLAIRGKKYYTQEEIYLDGQRMILAEVTLLRGRNTIRVAAQNINGVEVSAVYVVNNY
jgi:hypothetical protein